MVGAGKGGLSRRDRWSNGSRPPTAALREYGKRQIRERGLICSPSIVLPRQAPGEDGWAAPVPMEKNSALKAQPKNHIHPSQKPPYFLQDSLKRPLLNPLPPSDAVREQKNLF